MTRVLAAIDNSPAARSVLAAASSLAAFLHAEVEAVHAREDGDRTARAAAAARRVPYRTMGDDVVPTLLAAGHAPDVVAMALGARAVGAGRRPAGHVALQLAVSLPKPLVVVSPDAKVTEALRRILVPLNGDQSTAAALSETMELASESALEVIVLHVHDYASLPRFTDQPQHEVEAWTWEFASRHCPHPEHVRLEVRIGVPGEHVLRVAEELGADMIALGWSQELSGGHAAVVRQALEQSPVPVLLIPVGAPKIPRQRPVQVPA
jgi:nucleotide-binding universal stress UspA family protein